MVFDNILYREIYYTRRMCGDPMHDHVDFRVCERPNEHGEMWNY